MAEDGFQRARRPEQKAQRRAALLAAAGALIDEAGIEDVTLAAIAARAGVVKSNVYRYFESREDILLTLYLDELAALVAEVEAGLAAVRSGDLPAIAAVMGGAYAARPRLCALTAALASVLERNVSEDALVRSKRGIIATLAQAGAALGRAMPGLSPGACVRAGMMLHLAVAALWPHAVPGPLVARVLERPEFAAFHIPFPVMLGDMTLTALRGLAAAEGLTIS